MSENSKEFELSRRTLVGAMSVAAIAPPLSAMASVPSTVATAVTAAQVPGVTAASLPVNSHSATALKDGRVLVCGGRRSFDGDPQDAVLEVNGFTGSVTPVEPMLCPRADHSAVLMQDGRVVVFGGVCQGGACDTVEVYDPKLNTWRPLPPMKVARSLHTASVVLSTAFIVGGVDRFGNAVDTVEIYSLAARPAVVTP